MGFAVKTLEFMNMLFLALAVLSIASQVDMFVFLLTVKRGFMRFIRLFIP